MEYFGFSFDFAAPCEEAVAHGNGGVEYDHEYDHEHEYDGVNDRRVFLLTTHSKTATIGSARRNRLRPSGNAASANKPALANRVPKPSNPVMQALARHAACWPIGSGSVR